MLKQILEQGQKAADAALDRLLPPASQHPTSIHQAMRHSVFAGGKRLRPILCMEAGRMIRADGDDGALPRLGGRAPHMPDRYRPASSNWARRSKCSTLIL